MRLLFIGQRLEQLGHCQRLQFGIGLDQNAAVGADRHRGAQGFLALRDAAGDRDHFGDLAGLFQAHRFFHRDFIERIHRHFDVGNIDPRAVGFDAHLDVEVHHAFDWNQNFHSLPLK